MMEKRARFDLKQRDKTPTKWHPPLVEVNQAINSLVALKHQWHLAFDIKKGVKYP